MITGLEMTFILQPLAPKSTEAANVALLCVEGTSFLVFADRLLQRKLDEIEIYPRVVPSVFQGQFFCGRTASKTAIVKFLFLEFPV